MPAPPCATTGSSSTSRRCGPCGSTPQAARSRCRGCAVGRRRPRDRSTAWRPPAASWTHRRRRGHPRRRHGLPHARKHGLAVDNLLAAEVVTAEGSIVRASADEHPDLFWALRGGGGNFGVVTSFLFALHPFGPTVMAGPVFWAADTSDVLRFYRDFVAEAPDELGSIVRLGTVPSLPGIPEDLHRRPAIAVACCYAGAVEDGERAVRASAGSGRRSSTCSHPRRTSLSRAASTPPSSTGGTTTGSRRTSPASPTKPSPSSPTTPTPPARPGRAR